MRYRLPSSMRGTSLVELLVGVAVGLVVVAGASLLAASQLADHRRLQLETQVQQDLRTAADQVARGLLRAGFWHDAHQGTSTGAAGATLHANPYASITPDTDGASASMVTYAHAAPDADEDNVVTAGEQHGFRLRSGALETQLGSGNWQALTDPATLRVTRFEVTTGTQKVPLACARTCAAAATPCPATLQMRTLSIAIAGQAVHDPAVQRSMRSRIKLRNDDVVGECRD